MERLSEDESNVSLDYVDEGHVLLTGHDLKGEKGVLGVLSGLPLGTDFDKLADGEEGAKGHYQDDQNQRKEELPA